MRALCDVCRRGGSNSLYNEKLGLYRCSACGHIFSGRHLSDRESADLYGEKYFFGGEYCDYLADRKMLQKNFEERLKVLYKFIDQAGQKNLLEIGCAYGFFLDMVKDRFNNVKGIDISKEAVDYAKERLNLEAINGDFLKHDFGAEVFDIVCMWDVIEHLQDPRLYLEKAVRHMKSGALLAITTGDIGSLNARLRKEKWRLMHPPTHLHYFSRKTLTRLLRGLGFDIIYNRYCGFNRSIGAVIHRVSMKDGIFSPLCELLRKSKLMKLGFYLNLYDIVYVIARKR